MDCNPPGSSGHGILQARILEWVAISFSRGSSRPRDTAHISCLAGRFLTTESPGNPQLSLGPWKFIHCLCISLEGAPTMGRQYVIRQRTSTTRSCLPFHPPSVWLHQELPSSRRPKKVPEQMIDESPA